MVAGDGRGFVHRGLHLKSTGNDMDALLSSLTRKHWETGCSFNLKPILHSGFERHLPLVEF